MTTDEVLKAIADWKEKLGSLPAPLGPVLALATEIAADVVKIASITSAPEDNAIGLLEALRRQLSAEIGEEWQRKIDSQFPHTD